jgi:hypothetical protein
MKMTTYLFAGSLFAFMALSSCNDAKTEGDGDAGSDSHGVDTSSFPDSTGQMQNTPTSGSPIQNGTQPGNDGDSSHK